ncbi:DUF1549 and DUF1553 domain-containing protein [Stieleria varia]|uniref:BIG2 domain-containing protein n=1 Tax=Stieleria varia TaxID=2528005 RepID=A0A5C6AMZ7_9BACT|nr:DUF1549 and DUF1553 domain-containing protein [Stieleria varia]TWU00888.1 hypothetical protein Pla52n_42570 [Stieleria varia]
MKRNVLSLCCIASIMALGVLTGSDLIGSASADETLVATSVSATKTTSNASPLIAPIDQRYAPATATEVPDFQKHVVPLLGRLGCNGRACHGSFQGRGGFQLSLFGYDFKADHDALMEENSGRVDTDDVAESLMLAKPIDADVHEGGKRFDVDGWEYRVFKNWVADGAKFEKTQLQKLEQLEILPAEIRFADTAQSVQLQAIAHWADGTQEDVTPLCRFSSNDDSIADIDSIGIVKSGDRGDTHVVVYYDNAVVTIPVIRPIAKPLNIAASSNKPIDQLVQQKLNKLGVVPAPLCSDSEFIRRASLDITGVLPSAETVRDFLADGSSDKRERLVNNLLESPAYAAWWATRMSDWTGNNDEQLTNVLPVRSAATKLWFEWLRERLDNNVPYDQIIEGIVTAQSREDGEDYLAYCKSMTKACSGETEEFTQRSGMPLYWGRRNFQKPEDRAIGFAYTFLGVRIECAQCHKHPFDQWSKQDFEDFAKLFAPIRAGNANTVADDAKEQHKELLAAITGGKKLNGGDMRRAVTEAARKGETVPFGELLVNTRPINDKAMKAREQAKKKGRKVPPLNIPSGKILGQEQEVTLDADPRPALMQWLRDVDNPYFAKAIVNRVWDNYFGIGIVNPTDDMNLANPPSNGPLLDHLAADFISHGYDLKWLHREIVSSDTYQRSAQTNETNQYDRVNFARHIPRRLPAEVVYDMVVLATGSSDKAAKVRADLDQMAIADGKPRQRNRADFALEVFGQSIRETNCDCDRSDAPSLLQSIYLRNDAEMYNRISDRDGWVAEACKDLGIAGPKGMDVDPKQVARDRAADAMRRQVIGRVRGFTKADEARQAKILPQLERDYQRMTNKMVGYEVPELQDLIADPDSWTEVKTANAASGSASKNADATTLNDVIKEAYLRTLSRYPDDEEISIATSYVNESEKPASGIEGLLWALVNTKEFIISH